MSGVFLGIDTSNYTTSAAVVSEEGEILENSRALLKVSTGEKGLRQSDALFQHWKVLPDMLAPLLDKYRGSIRAVCAGNRPRPTEGSYMPVFTAGTGIGKTVACALGIEYCELSHQEGHFRAAAYKSSIDLDRPCICAHLSGGTLELILTDGSRYEKIGGTKDISYGQLIDRTGVDLGLSFPAGSSVDELALGYAPEGLKDPLCRVFTDKTYLNLSGLETRLKTAENSLPADALCYFLMKRISESFVSICESAKVITGADQVLVSGGVACSMFLRDHCKDLGYSFGQPALCSDNAAGEALYARERYGRQSSQRFTT